MKNYLILWPKSEQVVHINYHYTQFGEIIDYLKNKIKANIYAIDEDIESDINIAEFVEKNKIEKVVMMVNYENCISSFKTAKNIKDTSNEIYIFAYGPLTIMSPNLFEESLFDVIHANGDYEISICTFLKFYKNNLKNDINKLKGSKILKDGKEHFALKGEYILAEEWGVSRKENVPIKEYDKIKGKNRFILNISRGCPLRM